MNDPPELHRALDPSYYTDPDVFRAEQAGLFLQTWQYAGHVSQLASKGDYFAFEIAGQGLFCVRGQDGEIRTFYNVCQHRAHELVQGDGNCQLLVCPYHAWTYELTGQLRSGPNVRSVPGFDRSAICLTSVRTETLCGFIFVNLDPDAASLDDWFPGVERELASFVPNIDQLQPLEWIKIEEACNWKISIENYSECYHCQLNHPTFAKGVVKPETYDIQPQGHCLKHTTECQNLDRMSYSIPADSGPHAEEYASWYLWPTFSFQVYPGGVLNTYLWRPLAVDRVAVWRGWYTPNGADSEVIRRLAVQDRATTVEEDIRLVESVQRGVRSRGYRPGPLVLDPNCGVSSEHSLLALHKWMRESIRRI